MNTEPMPNRQNYYREQYKRLKPDWQDSMSLYREIIADFINGRSRVLDIGCGHGDFLKSTYEKAGETYGIDPDAEALEKNTFIHNKIVGTAEKMPFENDFFDVITSAWVLEHLDDPERVFGEIHRVLKSGG
jgi:ubiquinone/menaquinone biosynthesis C-methylase UbiE